MAVVNPDPTHGIVVALGRAPAGLAEGLGFASREGARFEVVLDALRTHRAVVIVASYPIAVRALARVLEDKARDPAVVAVDPQLRFATVLAGAHHGGNQLAHLVAHLVGAVPVVTTVSDAATTMALDATPGLLSRSIPPALQRRVNEGAAIEWIAPDLELPSYLKDRAHGVAPPVRIVVSDRLGDEEQGEMRMAAPTLVVGVGSASDATPDEVVSALDTVLQAAGLDRLAVAEIATIDRRRDHPALRATGHQIRTFTPERLAAIAVPNPSEVVAEAVATPSVAEAAALAAAGPGGVLVVAKQRFRRVTIAIARRSRIRGRLAVVGLGPGALDLVTVRARGVIADSWYLVGYERYLERLGPLIEPHHQVRPFPIGAELERVRLAVELAAGGNRVALVTSGDPAIYAMAGLAVELLAEDLEFEVVPGVSAAQAASARTGALLGHDHAVISLSDLLTPWPVIEARIEAAARADLVIGLYNPRSGQRGWQLEKALTIIGTHRSPDTVALLARRVERPGEHLVLTTLGELDPEEVDMETVVLVGARSSRRVGDLAVTPRGYRTIPAQSRGDSPVSSER